MYLAESCIVLSLAAANAKATEAATCMCRALVACSVAQRRLVADTVTEAHEMAQLTVGFDSSRHGREPKMDAIVPVMHSLASSTPSIDVNACRHDKVLS